MEKHICKLCFRHFSNGRALGGHMRSHVTSTKARLHFASASASSSSSHHAAEAEAEQRAVDVVAEERDEEGKGLGLSYGLRENPRKSFRMVDPEFSSTFAAFDGGISSVVQDRESETESSKPPSLRRRSKRPRRFPPPPERPEPEPVSSVSDATSEEDVALCLMMLSRDIWTKNKTKNDSAGAEEDQVEAEEEEEERSHRSEEEEPITVRSRRSKHQCDTCKKVFRSYQALGGHRASHKKTRGCIPAVQVQIQGADSSDANVDRARIHECPFCFRVFGSGQALGGHKRSHLSSYTTTTVAISSTALEQANTTTNTSSASPTTLKFGDSLFDLNLPAPMEEELSAVSDVDHYSVR